MKLFTFKGGIHPDDSKEHSEEKKIEVFKTPKKVFVPLLQNIGTPLDPTVKVGDVVKVGEKIGESSAALSVPVHSPVSGKVIAIEVMAYPVSGFTKTVVIENDEKEEWIETKKYTDYKKLSKEELIGIIRESGVVGEGGATFPTHIKLNPPKDKPVDTLIINGAECEPYLNADNRVMIENGKDVIEGIKVTMHVLGVKKAIIGIEENKKEAITIITELLKNEKEISVAVLATKYPQGGEKQLIKAILNRDVPVKKLPSEIGVVVLNVQTVKSIYEGVVLGKPLIERVLTVGGEGVKESKNYLVRIGVQFKDVLESVGYNRENTRKLIMGGPMMGLAQFTEDVPVIKGTSGILALSPKETKAIKPASCISCGKCIDTCPMGLMPVMYGKIAEVEKWSHMEEFNVLDCIECGSCSYICPAKRPLNESIKIGKAKLRNVKK